jgi:hypothetical protein
MQSIKSQILNIFDFETFEELKTKTLKRIVSDEENKNDLNNLIQFIQNTYLWFVYKQGDGDPAFVNVDKYKFIAWLLVTFYRKYKTIPKLGYLVSDKDRLSLEICRLAIE